MRFGPGPDDTAPIAWYWTKADAKHLEMSTCFASRRWDLGSVWPERGEVQEVGYKHRDGDFGPPVTGQGEPVGSEELWKYGSPTPIAPVHPRNAFGGLMAAGGLLAEPGNPTIGWQAQGGQVTTGLA